MSKIKFGRTDLSVSRLCFGCVSFGIRDVARDWDPFSASGRAGSLRLLHAARDLGVTLFDTSPDYGDGHSERLLGEAFRGRRSEVVIATKVDYGGKTPGDIVTSVEASLARLGTDHIDIIQFHGGNYPPASVKRILQNGLLDALQRLQSDGKVRHIGLTVTDPVTARSLIETGAFDTIQMLYNIVEQAAARHALGWACEHDMGITVMRPLAAGLLDRLLGAIAPHWAATGDVADVCLKFLLSDPRIHTINVGMRTEDELRHNLSLIETYRPVLDVSTLPRSVGQASRAAHGKPTLVVSNPPS